MSAAWMMKRICNDCYVIGGTGLVGTVEVVRVKGEIGWEGEEVLQQEVKNKIATVEKIHKEIV